MPQIGPHTGAAPAARRAHAAGADRHTPACPDPARTATVRATQDAAGRWDVVVDLDAAGPRGELDVLRARIVGDVVQRLAGSALGEPPSGRVVAVAPVTLSVGLTARVVLQDHDPLAVRLALLRCRPDEPAPLSPARLHRAEETLGRWRFKVAGWWHLPRAEPQDLGAVVEGLARDLDTSLALRTLQHLEADHGVPSGSKFTTFTLLDRVLGLDLGRLIGTI